MSCLNISVPPDIEPISDKVQIEGDVMVMECSATGTPTPLVMWSRVDRDRKYREGEQKVTIQTVCVYLIQIFMLSPMITLPYKY